MTINGVKIIPRATPMDKEFNESPVAVVLSDFGNQLAENNVKLFNIIGWLIAITTWNTKTKI